MLSKILRRGPLPSCRHDVCGGSTGQHPRSSDEGTQLVSPEPSLALTRATHAAAAVGAVSVPCRCRWPRGWSVLHLRPEEWSSTGGPNGV